MENYSPYFPGGRKCSDTTVEFPVALRLEIEKQYRPEYFCLCGKKTENHLRKWHYQLSHVLRSVAVATKVRACNWFDLNSHPEPSSRSEKNERQDLMEDVSHPPWAPHARCRSTAS